MAAKHAGENSLLFLVHALIVSELSPGRQIVPLMQRVDFIEGSSHSKECLRYSNCYSGCFAIQEIRFPSGEEEKKLSDIFAPWKISPEAISPSLLLLSLLACFVHFSSSHSDASRRRRQPAFLPFPPFQFLKCRSHSTTNFWAGIELKTFQSSDYCTENGSFPRSRSRRRPWPIPDARIKRRRRRRRQGGASRGRRGRNARFGGRRRRRKAEEEKLDQLVGVGFGSVWQERGRRRRFQSGGDLQRQR